MTARVMACEKTSLFLIETVRVAEKYIVQGYGLLECLTALQGKNTVKSIKIFSAKQQRFVNISKLDLLLHYSICQDIRDYLRNHNYFNDLKNE